MESMTKPPESVTNAFLRALNRQGVEAMPAPTSKMV